MCDIVCAKSCHTVYGPQLAQQIINSLIVIEKGAAHLKGFFSFPYSCKLTLPREMYFILAGEIVKDQFTSKSAVFLSHFSHTDTSTTNTTSFTWHKQKGQRSLKSCESGLHDTFHTLPPSPNTTWPYSHLLTWPLCLLSTFTYLCHIH